LTLDTQQPAPSAKPPARAGLAIRAVALGVAFAALCWLAHGFWLNSASVLDDHWHQRNLRTYGWSPSALIDATRIEPAAWQHLWWQNQSMYWEYARPVFILAMKLLYGVIGGNDPLPLHAASFALHWLNACLVAGLAWKLSRNMRAAALAGGLFILYPHAVISVAWPSALNCVLYTTLLLIALLLYVRASRLELCAAPGVSPAAPSAAPPLRRGVFATLLAVWIVGLFTRENTLLLPVMFVAMDLTFGGWRHARARWGPYLILAALGAAFVVWRSVTFTHPPPEVYVRLPAGEGIEYPLWLAAKLLHYLTTAVWFAPMSIGPTGRFNPWRESPDDIILMASILAACAFAYWLVARRIRGAWLWPLWIVLTVLPVLPVIATPHTGYACGVAVAIGLALADVGPMARLGNALAVTYLLISIPVTITNHWQWNAIAAAEMWGLDSMLQSAPPPGTQHIFAINTPFVNVYAKPALAHKAPARFAAPQWHTLVYAAQPVVLEDDVEVIPLDDHRLEVRTRGQPFFSRLLGRFLFESFRDGPRFKSGDRVSTPHFDVEIADADVHGVRRLIFTFPRPLDDPSYCFYVSTADCGALRLNFDHIRDAGRPAPPLVPQQPPGAASAVAELADRVWRDSHPAAIDSVFAALESSAPAIHAAAQTQLENLLGVTARAMASPALRLVEKPDKTDADWAALRTWWHAEVTPQTLHDLRRVQEGLSHLLKLREELPHALYWASKAVRSDLYLTGPPFPTSRDELAAGGPK
jgi:hypothetical protein